MKLLALDFDGVISDSAPEAFVVALRTWCELHPESGLHDRRALLEGPAAPAPEAVLAEPLYADFLVAMPLGNRAEDYAVELSAAEAKEPLPDQAAYDAYKASIPRDDLRSFQKRFYRIRAALSAADPAAWHRLIGPYPGILSLLRRRADDAVLTIATAKDRGSVGKLLTAYGIADLFPEGTVLDKETGVSKRCHLEHLQQRYGFTFEELTFIDDKVNHLDTVAPLGVRCGLAAWGYNGEREASLARAAGYRVLRLEDLEVQLFDG